MSTLFLSNDKIFYTLEGEGKYVGQPSVFMRMSMCNLTCQGFKSASSPHGCDSFVSWSIKNKLAYEKIAEMFEVEGYDQKLKAGAILKYTGGEPFIQQKSLLEFTEFIVKRWGFLPRIDFETNATLVPYSRWVVDFNATFTTSPKLACNGDPVEKRYVEEALVWHAVEADDGGRSSFKFVVSGENDVAEIFEHYINKFEIAKKNVWFMPMCGSRAEHIEVAPAVAELAKKYEVNFSPRLHLLLWDMALKV
jgi:7-carboxy-7-deazaguanine synthase